MAIGSSQSLVHDGAGASGKPWRDRGARNPCLQGAGVAHSGASCMYLKAAMPAIARQRMRVSVLWCQTLLWRATDCRC